MAGSRKRLSADWFAVYEGGVAHAFTHKPGGLSEYSACGLPLDASYVRANHPRCGPCEFVLKRNFR